MLKKFFFILLFFIFIIFLFNFNDCDASFDLNYNGEIISLPDLPVDDRVSEDMISDLPYIIAYSSYQNAFCFFIPRFYIEGGIFTYEGIPSTNNNHLYYKNPSSNSYGQFYGYVLRDGNWVYNSGIVDYLNYVTDVSSLLFSTSNIYQNDGSDIFFNASFSFDLNFIETENIYQVVSKSSIDYDRFNYITATITDSNNNTYNLNWEFSDLDEKFYIYYYDIYENGTYIINIIDSEKDEEYTFTINCTEIDEDFGSLNLHLSTEEQTTEPIYVLSNRYYYEGDYDISQDFLQNYSIEIAYRLR